MQQIVEGTQRRSKRTGEVQVFQGGQWVSQGGAPSSVQPMVVGTPRPKQPAPQTPTQAAIDQERLNDLRSPPPSLPQGYRMGPNGVAELIPGLPKPKGADGNPIPQNFATDLQSKVSAYSDLQRAINDFDTGYSGAGAGIESVAQGLLPVGTPGQRDWWADFKRTDNITRNVIFGASLSEGEKAAYEQTTVTPNMRPEEIKRNLNRRLEIARSVLARQKEFLAANGYKQEAIDALTGGVNFAAAPMAVDDGGDKVEGQRLTKDQEAELFQFLKTKPGRDQINAWFSQHNFDGAANADELADAAATGKPIATSVNYGNVDDAYRESLKSEHVVNDSDAKRLITQGATLGLSDEASGIGGGLVSLFQGENPVVGYQRSRDAERVAIQEARQNLGGTGTALELGGSFASGNVSNALKSAPTLLGRMGQGAKAGAVGGGVAGFGYGEGLNSLLTALGGATVGAGVGAAIPVATSVIGNRVEGLQRLTGRDPALPRRIIGEAIDADGATPTAVGKVMDDAGTRGSPMMLADTGDNARSLFASVTRQPGPAKKIGKTAAVERQKGQAERISAAVIRDLGPTANIREMGDALIEQARNASRPHYQKFEAAPGASVVKLDDLAARPSFQKALRNAVGTAQEEGVDPTTLGITFNEAGETAIDHAALSWRSLDAIKRGLDDVIEGYRDSTTGKLNLNTGTARATQATLRTLIARMDKINPHYATARAAYAGPAAMRDALNKGVKSLTKSPDDIMAMMKNMGEGEQESFRLGVRKSIIDLLGAQKDGGDKVSRLLGTPKSRAVLTRVFGGKAEFGRFIKTLRDEEAMGNTYKAVTGNSQTAERLAQDAQTNDTGLAETAMDAALRGGKDGMWSALVTGLQKLRDVDRFGAGQAGERTRESIAALLSETDPAVLKELLRAANRASAKQRVRTGQKSRNAVRSGRNVGDIAGMSAGRMSEQP